MPVVPEERRVTLLAEDGVALDARLSTPPGAARAVVLAHPHPLYGGSMDDPVTVAFARALAERGAATLRFDFRGVGHSEGRFGGGEPEVLDLEAAIAFVAGALSDVPIAVSGYSFGSWVALGAARAGRVAVDRLALVAPALGLLPYDRLPSHGGRFERPVAVVVGDRDGFCDAAAARVFAGRLGASVAVLSGEDHFFSRARRRVAEMLAPFLLGARDRVDEGDFA